MNVWKDLATEFAAANEPTLATDMYDTAITLLKKTQRPTMSYDFLLEISEQYARFQDY